MTTLPLPSVRAPDSPPLRRRPTFVESPPTRLAADGHRYRVHPEHPFRLFGPGCTCCPGAKQRGVGATPRANDVKPSPDGAS